MAVNIPPSIPLSEKNKRRKSEKLFETDYNKERKDTPFDRIPERDLEKFKESLPYKLRRRFSGALGGEKPFTRQEVEKFAELYSEYIHGEKNG